MAIRTGICNNKGLCNLANLNAPLKVADGAPFICPGCMSPLDAKKAQMQPWLLGLAGLVVAVVLGVGIGLARNLWNPNPNGNQAETEATPEVTETPSVTEKPAPLGKCSGEVQRDVFQRVRSRKKLILGVQADAAPMNYVDEESSRRKGFDYELARLIVGQMKQEWPGVRVEVREVDNFKDLFCLLNQKEKDGSHSADLIMSGIARDPAYDSVIDWSNDYVGFSYALIANRNANIKNLEDCKGKKVGIVAEDNRVKEYVEKNLPGAQIIVLDDADRNPAETEDGGTPCTDKAGLACDIDWLDAAINGYTDIKNGKKPPLVDAIIYDFPFAVVEVNDVNATKRDAKIIGQYLEIKKARLPNSDLSYCIGVPKGNVELLDNINAAISEITDPANDGRDADPRYQKLMKDYFTAEKGTISPVVIEAGAKVYDVKAGDSLSKIAFEQLGNSSRYKELQDLNPNIPNRDLIFPGDKLRMPNDYTR